METYKAKQVNTVVSGIPPPWFIWYALTVETMQSNTVKYIQTQHLNSLIQQSGMWWCWMIVCNDSPKTNSVACWIVTLIHNNVNTTAQLSQWKTYSHKGAYLIYDKSMYIVFMFVVFYFTHVKIISTCLCTTSHLSFQAVYRNDILSGAVGPGTWLAPWKKKRTKFCLSKIFAISPKHNYRGFVSKKAWRFSYQFNSYIFVGVQVLS